MKKLIEKSKQASINLLRSTEKYTRTDMVYFFQGNFWLNANRAIGILNGIVLSIAFAHLLTKESYGMYSFAFDFIGIFSMAQTTGLGNGIIRGIAKDGGTTIIEEGLRRVFPWSLLGAFGLIISALYYLIHGNTSLAVIFFTAGIVLPTSVSSSVAKSYYSNRGDFGKLAQFNIIRTPLVTALIVVSALITRSAVVVALCQIIGNTLLGIWLYLGMKRDIRQLPTTSNVTEEFNTKYAYHSAALSIFTYISDKIDDLLLWKFLGGESLAIYSYASAPVRELRTLMENQGSLALPKYAKKEYSDVRKSVTFRIKQMYLVAFPLVILYIIGAPYLFKFIFPQYIAAIPYSQLAALSILASPRRLMNAAIYSHQKIRESYIMVILPNITGIIGAIILIPPYGITGAVIALLVSEVIDYIVLGTLMRRPIESTEPSK